MHPERSTGTRGRLAPALALALCATLMSGCILNPEVPLPELDLPGAYKQAAPKAGGIASSPYDFSVFRSKRLTDLISAARSANLDVGAAIARIQQAEAQVRVATQPLIPLIQANGSGSVDFSQRLGSPVRTTSVVAQLTASYEIDFWGRNRAGLYAAQAAEWAQSFDAATVAITTDANVANTYFSAVAARKQIDIARQNLGVAERTLQIVRERQQAGTVSGLDVAQQETLTANVRATIPPLERDYQQFQHALAVLTGIAPEDFRFKGEDLFAIGVPRIDPGLPSELLCRRPDIAFAEAQLTQASYNTSQARAALFPSIQLTGSGGFQSVALASLFQPQSVFYNAAVGITQPITNAYSLTAIVDQNQARYAELLNNYRQSIISSFRDVNDALVAYRKNAEQERLQMMAVQSARRAFQLTETQLRGGVVDLTTVLQVQTTLFTAENALVQVRLSRLQAAVSLYRALGGGWVKPLNSGIAEMPSIIGVREKTPSAKAKM
jgi:NodT family efflux transporter outer membrane factor (OMF) lipoprotein